MGHVFAICGCSGVGKTTFLRKLLETNPRRLKLLVRSTSRPRRPKELEGLDYNFYSTKGFLHKVSSNDFLHVESYGDYLFGIEEKIVEDVIYDSKSDGILMAGIYGALHLKDKYKESVTILYLFPGKENAIFNPDCLEGESGEIKELIQRLSLKYAEGDIEPNDQREDEASYIQRRMQLNYAELAFTIGKLRNKHNIKILENLRGEIDNVVIQFTKTRSKTIIIPQMKQIQENHSFVLMPFRPELKPIYEEHIKPVMERMGFKCLRSDAIFSNRPIIEDIIEAVQSACLIISDLTDANPNVFYETGYCHALGKKVILITQENEVPFDLQGIRHIRYSYTPPGMRQLESSLEKTVKKILNI